MSIGVDGKTHWIKTKTSVENVENVGTGKEQAQNKG